jgi:hypothetical protein
MRLFLKRILQLIGFGSLTLMACIRCKYGVPVDVDPYKAVKTISGDQQPIKGLSVILFENSDSITFRFTDDKGLAEFEYQFYKDFDYKVAIKDIDGDENLGSYKSTEKILNDPDTTEIIMQIESE